jgi:hypothetical protein
MGWGLCELGVSSTEFILSLAEGLRTCLAGKNPKITSRKDAKSAKVEEIIERKKL